MDQRLFAQSKDALTTRAHYQNEQLVAGNWPEATGPFFGVIIQYTVLNCLKRFFIIKLIKIN